MPTLEYTHVDVFSEHPYGGNSLPVFPDAGGLTADQMLSITQELRHFEAIFLELSGAGAGEAGQAASAPATATASALGGTP